MLLENNGSSPPRANDTACIQSELSALLGALDNLGTYFYAKDLKGRYTYANRLACELIGLPLSGIIGKTDGELFAPDHCADWVAVDRRVLSGGESIALEETQPRGPHHEPRIYWSVKAPIRDQDGRITGLCGVSTDITAHKRAERQAQALQERLAQRAEQRSERLEAEIREHALTDAQLQLAIDGAELGIWQYRLQPEQFVWSDRCKRHLGLPASETPSYAGFIARVHPQDRKQVQALIAHSLKTHEDYAAEYRLRWDDGSEHWISALGRVYCDADGSPARMAGITLDITARKQAEQALCEREQAAKRQLAEIQAYYDTAPVGQVVLDTELRYLRINQRLAESNGHPIAAHIGRTVREMVPHLAASLEPKLRQVIATGEPLLDQEISGRPQGQDGRTTVHLEHFYPLRDDAGKVYGINVVVEDITEWRAMEQAFRELNARLERKVAARTGELHAANAALRESETRYRTLFDSAGDAIVILATNGDFLDVNATACRLYGYDRASFLRLNIADIDIPDDHAQIPERIDATLAQGVAAFEAHHRTANGRVLTIEAKAVTITVDERTCMLAVWRDISERKRTELALQESHQRLNRVLDAMDAAVYITDIDTYELLFLNDAAKAIWGDSAGGRCYEVLHGQEHPCASCTNGQLVDAAGEPSGVYQWELYHQRTQRWYALRDCAIRWGDERLVRVEIATDVTAYKEAQAHIEHLAYYDGLTGLPNRVHLIEQLERLIPASEQGERMLAVCFLNLDDFKPLNERHGHAFGDAVLVALAQRLRAALREEDWIARAGSDEFALLLTGLESSFAAVEAVQDLLRQIHQALEVEGQRLHLSASLGLTLFPIDHAGPDALLQHAHEALFQAKGHSKGGYRLYDPIQDHQARQRQHLYQEFARALANDELVLDYQPKIRLADGQLFGFEALLRWQHPDKGLLGPNQFLPRIEGSPLELTLGEWVIATALAQQQRWREQGQDLLISVNISPRQLQEPGFSAFLARELEAHGQAAPTRLEIEILEIAQLDDALAAAEVMRACKDLGVGFSLDDFGTGYASLTYFQQLPIDVVKIDRRFVLNMLDNPEDRAIVEGVLHMAQTLPRPVLAEGVESLEIGQMLQQFGCQYAQGYGIARPMPADQVLAWLSSWATDQRWHPQVGA